MKPKRMPTKSDGQITLSKNAVINTAAAKPKINETITIKIFAVKKLTFFTVFTGNKFSNLLNSIFAVSANNNNFNFAFTGDINNF